MPLPFLIEPPRTDDGWSTFWFDHWQDHLEIQQAILKQKGVNLPIYIITPWSNNDAEGILGRHQQFHDDMDEELNLSNQDVSTIDFKDPISVQQWLFANFYEHQNARAALGI